MAPFGEGHSHQDTQISLPKNSYTVFRLKYCDAFELYNTSTVRFLGNIPPAWILDKKSILLAKIFRLQNLELEHPKEARIEKSHKNGTNTFKEGLHRIDKKIKDNTLNRIRKSKDDKNETGNPIPAINVIESSNLNEEENERRPPSLLARNISHEHRNRYSESFHRLLGNISDSSYDSESDSLNESIHSNLSIYQGKPQSDVQQEPTSKSTHPNQINEELTVFMEKPDSEKREILREELNTAMESLYRPLEMNSKTQGLDPTVTTTNATDDASFITAEESISDGNDSNHIETEDDNRLKLRRQTITFDIPESHERKIASKNDPAAAPLSNAQSAYTIMSQHQMLDKQMPTPYQHIDDNNQLTHIEEEGFDEKSKDALEIEVNEIDESVAHDYDLLKTKTIGAKVGLSHELNKFERKRNFRRLVKNFQTGDIIKLDKMLVLVSTIEKLKMNKESTKSSRILERWREYIVVVRATNDVDYPAVIQFFKSNKILRKDKEERMRNEIIQNELEKQQMEDLSAEKDKEKEEYHSEVKDGLNSEHSIDENLDGHCTISGTLRTLKAQEGGNLKDTLETNKHFFKDKVSEGIAKTTREDHFHFSLVLSRRDTTVSFANLLDKSIQINKEKRTHTVRYILLAHSCSSAITWFSFLRHLLKFPSVKEISEKGFLINIPCLDLSFTISGLPSLYSKLKYKGPHISEEVLLKYTAKGYKYPKSRGFNLILDMVSAKLRDLKTLNRLPQTLESKDILEKLEKDRSFLALTFRKYDRLEWILGENETIVQNLWSVFGSSFELELRQFEHESHNVVEGMLNEPFPVEGFLAKLSNQKGNHKSKVGKQYYKLLYVFTAGSLLFLHNFYEAVPYFPKDAENAYQFINSSGEVLDDKKLEEAAIFEPGEYLCEPYPRSGNHISWLKPGITTDEFLKHDANAMFQAERKSCMILSSDAVVDLCKVTDIKLVSKNEINLILKTTGKTVWGHNSKEEDNTDNEDEITETCFDLLMEDGSSLRFQATTRTIRNEWAQNLSKLCTYWTAKKREDLVKAVLMKEKNHTLLNSSDDSYESQVANENSSSCSKWELAKAYTDTQIYSISAYALDKPVLMDGYLYCKKFKGKQFKVLHAVLIPGFLVLYDVFNRSKIHLVAGKCTYQRKYASISLANCYAFARVGKSTTEVKSQIFSNSLEGSNGLPRIYSNGWRSGESVEEKSFTLWFGSKKTLIRNVQRKTGTALNLNLTEHGAADHITGQGENELEDGDSSENPMFKSKKFGIERLKRKMKIRKELKKKDEKLEHSYLDSQTDSDTYESSDYSSESDGSYQEDSSTEEEYDSSDEGCHSDEEEVSCLEDELLQRNISGNEKASKRKLLKSMQAFGATGRAVIFLCQSRIERDVWVTRLMAEIERSSNTRDANIEFK